MKRFFVALSCAVIVITLGFTLMFRVEGQKSTDHRHGSDSPATNNATVSFGGWMTDVPIDRFVNSSNTQFPIARNHHTVVPEIAKIKAGGYVNFIIGGFHVVAVYDDGTLPADIDTTLTHPPQGQAVPPIINDPDRRIYRGLDPSILPAKAQQDRVEVVHFDTPGTYLVICAVLPHFNQGMYGYVRVLPSTSPE